MTEEDKELLARISQLAGQINRHKNQQAGHQPAPSYHPPQHRHNTYRHASAPYPLEVEVVAVIALRLFTTILINANVYEKESQNRAKAIEETRLRKINSHHSREKHQFDAFVQHQAGAGHGSTNVATSTGKNEITIDGIRFGVMDGGKKLVKLQGRPANAGSRTRTPTAYFLSGDDLNSASTTPKTTTIAGVKFYRTKTGNLVANRIVQSHRRSGKIRKNGQRCKIFSTTGSCPKGPTCRYTHDPHKVAICKDFLKDGTCARGESCDLSHDLRPERVPNCLHYAKGHCAKADCAYTHSKSPAGAPVCADFGFYGYCDKGAECTERHVFECPDFSNTGRCKNRGCKLLHRERASVLRRADEAGEDVSSDEEADSDDVDSDEVAEFIEADSDSDTETEGPKSFLPI
ncbi:hypothetical protein B0I35DRAFT_473673 [Stachybotrys elegans]|uniref:C3H1-type domain-containing protein n=1 Tax=Stachybotrys elegans TaxID=80388 RepID=A0A8K0WX98_9HYPO|nr:hypothetical protein B0I35DRAFT_473673 [Stachybotrys elegans]